MSEENIDLSEFDEIPDRVARARAKAEAMRKARKAAAGDASAATPAEGASGKVYGRIRGADSGARPKSIFRR